MTFNVGSKGQKDSIGFLTNLPILWVLQEDARIYKFMQNAKSCLGFPFTHSLSLYVIHLSVW